MTNSTNNLTREQKIANFLKALECEEIDLPYFADESQRSYEDLRNSIEDGDGFDVEIIYYSKAMEYLANNDPSLSESLQIASEVGYTPDQLNSEILASLLASQNARSNFQSLESEIEDFFTELNEEEEEAEQIQEEREGIFEPTGYLTISNTGGIELMIDEAGETALYRFTAGNTDIEEAEIQYDLEGEPYILIGEAVYYLNEFHKI